MDALDSTTLSLVLFVVLLLLLLIFLLPFPTEQFNSINCEMCFEGLPFPKLNICSPEGVDNAGLFGERGEENVGESGGVRENVVCRIFPLLYSSQDLLSFFVPKIEKETQSASFIIIISFQPRGCEEVGKQKTTTLKCFLRAKEECGDDEAKFFS